MPHEITENRTNRPITNLTMGLAENISCEKSPAAPVPGVNKASDSVVFSGCAAGRAPDCATVTRPEKFCQSNDTMRVPLAEGFPHDSLSGHPQPGGHRVGGCRL